MAKSCELADSVNWKYFLWPFYRFLGCFLVWETNLQKPKNNWTRQLFFGFSVNCSPFFGIFQFFLKNKMAIYFFKSNLQDKKYLFRFSPSAGQTVNWHLKQFTGFYQFTESDNLQDFLRIFANLFNLFSPSGTPFRRVAVKRNRKI